MKDVDPRNTIRRQIIEELSTMADEYRQVRVAAERLKELEIVRWGLIRAYEELTPEITGDALERADQVDAVVQGFRRNV